MDSLLGIGIAGGGTSKGEGKALASRLSEMRKESNERAKAKSVTKKKPYGERKQPLQAQLIYVA